MMSLWSRLQHALGSPFPTGRGFILSEELHRSLQELAKREQRPVDQVAAEMLSFALADRLDAEEYLWRWRGLTPREQQVVALFCQDYSSQQIADLLVVSPETVKTHLRNALRKLKLKNKTQLRTALANWEFDEDVLFP
jgi:DNA-binding CsgD family transcriptional regulator